MTGRFLVIASSLWSSGSEAIYLPMLSVIRSFEVQPEMPGQGPPGAGWVFVCGSLLVEGEMIPAATGVALGCLLGTDPVLIPIHGVGLDVCDDTAQVALVSDDMLVIIALPDGVSGGISQAVDLPGDGGLVRAHDGGDGAMYRLAEGLFRWCAVIVIDDENDGVDVVRHDHKFPQADMGEALCQAEQFLLGDLPGQG
jgi:hypothetical protein